MLDREQNELINNSVWVIKDEDARQRLSFEGRHAELVYEQTASKTRERADFDQDNYGWNSSPALSTRPLPQCAPRGWPDRP